VEKRRPARQIGAYRKVDLTPPTMLRALAAARSDFLIGVGGLDMKEVDNPKARAVLTQHFNAGTAGNVCKYGVVQRTLGNYNFDACDAVRNLVVDSVRGRFRLHTLAWGNQNQPWLLGLSASEKRQNLINSIKETVTHYGALMLSTRQSLIVIPTGSSFVRRRLYEPSHRSHSMLHHRQST